MKTEQKNSRREFIRKSALAAAGTLTVFSMDFENSFASVPGISESLIAHDEGAFTLPPLPYDYKALEPNIDVQTMTIHHDKHHQAYVDNLNKAVAQAPELKGKSIEDLIRNIDELPEGVRKAIRNNGGGHWNHSFFWKSMTPKSGTMPSGKLKDAMTSKWQTMDAFKEEFNKAATGVFGSGWAWLIRDKDGKLMITSTPNQDNPLMNVSTDKGKPIIGVDVWEHAYYLKHQNKRADYLKDWWNVVNWDAAMQNYG